MTCTDVEQLLDGFVDAELVPSDLLAIARHAASCPACDQSVQEITALHEHVARTVREQAARLDLSDVWPSVAAAVDHRNSHRAHGRRLRAVSLLGGGLAAAASVAFWLAQAPPTQPPSRVATTSVSRRQTNLALIDRLAGKKVAVRREPKAGTTIIWVDYNSGLPELEP